MNRTVDIVGTIYVPEDGGIIEEDQIDYFLGSLQNNIDTRIEIAYNNANLSFIPDSGMYLYKIEDKDYIGRRDYFKIENTKRLIQEYNPYYHCLLAILDVDMVIAKLISLEDDFDIAFTLKHPGHSEVHPINLGASFFHIKKNNKNKLLEFMDGWLDAPISRDNEVYNEYMSLPAIRPHKKYEMDRIVHQDYICALAWENKWFKEGIYEYNNLRIKILGHKYNHTWRFGDPLDKDVIIYHLRGEKQSKLERSKELYKQLYG